MKFFHIFACWCIFIIFTSCASVSTQRQVGATSINTAQPSTISNFETDEIRLSLGRKFLSDEPFSGTTASGDEGKFKVNATSSNNLKLETGQELFQSYLSAYINDYIFMYWTYSTSSYQTTYFFSSFLGSGLKISTGSFIVTSDIAFGLKDYGIQSTYTESEISTPSSVGGPQNMGKTNIEPFVNTGLNVFLDYGITPFVGIRVEGMNIRPELGASTFFLTINTGLRVRFHKTRHIYLNLSSYTNTANTALFTYSLSGGAGFSFDLF